MKIIRGKIKSAQKIVLYGPEGIGKSTFASKFPGALFIDTEGSTKRLDVARTQAPSSWTMLMNQIDHIKKNPDICKTLVIDTVDWAERLAINHICARDNKSGLADWGYGNGWVYLAEEFGRLLNSLTELINLGINIVFTAHAHLRKFEQPDEMGAYDRWELKLERKTAPLVKEWADMVLFANYKTYVIVDETTKSKKAQGGKRVMYTSHHPAWDAKNREDLPEELPLDFEAISHVLPDFKKEQAPKEDAAAAEQPTEPPKQAEPEVEASVDSDDDWTGIPEALADLMRANNVAPWEIQQAVSIKGYYPENTPIENYDAKFIQAVLVAAWEQVYEVIKTEVAPF